ncbi:MAG: serpin family protein [Labilithrix sp.]|nr:serpin family protein [Labilithrix sp.]MCW5833990.1 serpin family protein [Labilithrix sp.]
MKSAHVALLLALGLGLSACSDSESDAEKGAGEKVEVARSSQQRDTNPELTDAERASFAASQATFAVDLYRAVAEDPDHAGKDLFLSPHSVSTALAMTYAGARGENAAEMREALRFDLPDDRIHVAFNALDLALESRGEGADGADGEPFRLSVTNSIWGQKGAPFEAPYLDTLARNYGAGLNLVDFVNETEASRRAINAWVEEQTEKRIKDLLPSGAIRPTTRLVLTNAVYFNAAWSTPFEPSLTRAEPFTKIDGASTDVQMMVSSESRRYARGDGYEAVELPYQGYELSMLVIAPEVGSFATFESALTGGKVLDILAGLEQKEVLLHFPKLEIEMDAPISLVDPLKSLGMVQAFDGGDFSGISATMPLSVSDVLHKTFLKIDEKGTEAAAATAVVFDESAAADPPESIEVKVDRPFFTAIVDRQTKAIVFFGRILEPRVK